MLMVELDPILSLMFKVKATPTTVMQFTMFPQLAR
jgi:hypothetical protein